MAFGSGGAEVRRQKAEVCETEVCRVCDFRVAWHAEKVMTADVDLQGGAERWAAGSRSAVLGSDD